MIDDRYLVASYEMAVGAFEEYLDQYDKDNEAAAKSSLLKAAAILCSSLSHLGNDGEFWDRLGAFMKDAKAHRPQIEQHLKDLESFVEIERQVFEKAGLCRKTVARLLGDTELALKELRRTGWPDDLRFLRQQLNEMSVGMCNLSRGKVGEGWLGVAFFQVRKGLRVLGGGVTIATNVVSIPTLGLFAYLSGVIGASMIADSFDSPPKKLRRQ